MIELLIVLSNVALVLVTAASVWLTIREEHRHEEEEQREHNKHSETETDNR